MRRTTAASVTTVLLVVSSLFLGAAADASASTMKRWIAFADDRNGNSDIYVMREDGKGLVQLTTSLADDFGPAWSPDGRRLAFWSSRGGIQQIYVMNADGSKQHPITKNTQPDNPHDRFPPDWSPDGRRIVFEMNQDLPLDCNCTNIYVIRADGSQLKRITSGNVIDAGPDWSPDGKRIVFARQGGAGATTYPEIYSLRIDRAGYPERRLTTNTSYEWSPEWSPDGRSIVFMSNRPHGPGERFDIYLMQADGSKPRKLTSKAWNGLPSWSRDGREIVFERDSDGPLFSGIGCFPERCPAVGLGGPATSDLWVMAANGSHARPLTSSTSNELTPVFKPL